MSIEVFITRRANPLDEDGENIQLEEWEQCIFEEHDFRHAEASESRWLGKHARIWTGHSIAFAFDWNGGQVDVKNPDAPTIARMMNLADKLSARVFSETGEIFDRTGNHMGFLEGFP